MGEGREERGGAGGALIFVKCRLHSPLMNCFEGVAGGGRGGGSDHFALKYVEIGGGISLKTLSTITNDQRRMG